MAHDSTNLVKSRLFGSVTRKAVMLVLADYTDADWSTFVGQKRAAAEAEVSERTVRSALAEFEREGLISRTHRGREGDRGGRTSDRIQLHREAIEKLPVAFAGKSRIQTANAADSNGKAIAGEQSEEPKEEEASSSSGSAPFADFHAKRAVEAVDKRRRNGLKVKSRIGLAKTIAQDPDFIEESKRIFAHRDCAKCKGKGVIEEYSPGAGTRHTTCVESTLV